MFTKTETVVVLAWIVLLVIAVWERAREKHQQRIIESMTDETRDRIRREYVARQLVARAVIAHPEMTSPEDLVVECRAMYRREHLVPLSRAEINAVEAEVDLYLIRRVVGKAAIAV